MCSSSFCLTTATFDDVYESYSENLLMRGAHAQMSKEGRASSLQPYFAWAKGRVVYLVNGSQRPSGGCILYRTTQNVSKVLTELKDEHSR